MVAGVASLLWKVVWLLQAAFFFLLKFEEAAGVEVGVGFVHFAGDGGDVEDSAVAATREENAVGVEA